MNMGAGRIVIRIIQNGHQRDQDGTFFENPLLLKAIESVKANNSAFHLYGLLSDGGVLAIITHLYWLLELVKRHGLEKVYVHCFLDSRDTAGIRCRYIKRIIREDAGTG